MDLQKFTPHNLSPFQRRLAKDAAVGNSKILALSIARGGAKSFLAGLIAAEELTERGGEIFCFASSLKQASIVFRECVDALEYCYGEDELGRITNSTARFRIWDNQIHYRIEDRLNGGFVEARAADPNRVHGLRPNLVLLDEPAQLKNGGDALWSALLTSLGKHDNSRIIVFGTRPSSGNHWFARLLDEDDPEVTTHIYAADPDLSMYSWRNVAKANPGLRHGFPASRPVRT